MPKRKLPIDPEAEERKEIENLNQKYVEHVCCISGNYARFVLAPRILAERRRRAGDPAASPRDYDCVCNVPDADGVPICRGKRAECRFKGLKAPRPIGSPEDSGMWSVHSEERWRLTERFRCEDPALVLAECRKMSITLDRVNALRRREFGEDFRLASTAFLA